MTYPQVLVFLADRTPEPEDVKAGWTAFALFLILIVAVALLGFSLIRHLRRAAANEQAGLFGHDEEKTESSSSSSPQP